VGEEVECDGTRPGASLLSVEREMAFSHELGPKELLFFEAVAEAIS